MEQLPNANYSIPSFSFYNADNMDIMKCYPDKYFDLAIVDPPYGIGASKPSKKPSSIIQKNGSRLNVKNNNYINKDWDNIAADKAYFYELFRVSKNQIIFGCNYYDFSFGPGRIVWDKLNGESDQMGCEIAYNSFNNRCDIVYYMWCGMFQGVYCGYNIKKAITQQGNKSKNEIRIHPTQKPVALYSWLIQKYAKQGDKILDTHLGSGSIALAIDKANKLDGMDLSFVGIELDKDYFDASIARFKDNSRQTVFEFQ